MSNNQYSILLVEDDPLMQEMIADMLEMMGHDVELASDGAEGLSIYKQSPDAFCLIVSDVDMPNMDGVKMLSNILEINPNQRSVLITGVPEQEHKRKGRDIIDFSILLKPFGYDEMEQLVLTLCGSQKNGGMVEVAG